MLDVETFGDPNNPFNEPLTPELNQLVNFDPVRRVAAEMIWVMMECPDRVVSETGHDGHTIRKFQFECTAPFETRLGVFINGAASFVTDHLRDIRKMPVAIELGDLIVENEITKRWLTLRRVDGGKFGVTGLGQRTDDRLFEKWRALTMVINRSGGGVAAELWGESVIPNVGTVATILPSDRGYYVGDHYTSLQRALQRTQEKLHQQKNLRHSPQPIVGDFLIDDIY